MSPLWLLTQPLENTFLCVSIPGSWPTCTMQNVSGPTYLQSGQASLKGHASRCEADISLTSGSTSCNITDLCRCLSCFSLRLNCAKRKWYDAFPLQLGERELQSIAVLCYVERSDPVCLRAAGSPQREEDCSWVQIPLAFWKSWRSSFLQHASWIFLPCVPPWCPWF